MKLTVNPSDLAGALARLKPIAAGKATLPILNSVLLRAEGETLRVSATDLDVYLTLHVKAEVETPGSAVVSCARLSDMVRQIDGDALELSTGAKPGLSGVAGDWRLRLITFAPEEFPPAPGAEKLGQRIVLEPGILAKGIDRVLSSVSTDETRYVLNGAHFTIEDESLILVATDGRRLTLTRLATKVESSGLAVTVPTKALKLLACTDGGGAKRLDFGEVHFSAEGDGWELIGKVIEGNYPSFRQVIPEPGRRTITVGRMAFLEALPFVDSVCTKTARRVVLEAEGKRLSLSAGGADIGEASADLAATVKGGALSVAFNPDLLADALHAIDGDQVTLAIADEMSPLRIDEEGTTVVLMPMRVS